MIWLTLGIASAVVIVALLVIPGRRREIPETMGAPFIFTWTDPETGQLVAGPAESYYRTFGADRYETGEPESPFPQEERWP